MSFLKSSASSCAGFHKLSGFTDGVSSTARSISLCRVASPTGLASIQDNTLQVVTPMRRQIADNALFSVIIHRLRVNANAAVRSTYNQYNMTS